MATNLSIPETIQRIVESATPKSDGISTAAAAPLTRESSSTTSSTLQLVPLINAFEEAVTDQRRLLGTLQERLRLLSISLLPPSSEYSEDEQPESFSSAEVFVGDLTSRVAKLGEAFASLFGRYTSLRHVFDSSSSIVSPAGRHLAQLQLQKKQSTQVRDLLSVWMDIRTGRGTARLDARLEANDPDTRKEGAQLMRRLLALQEAMGTENHIEEIAELGKRYEAQLLEEFHAAFAENELPAMRLAASLLVAFNGGESCIQSFISQHAFFLEPTNPDAIKSAFHAGPDGSLPVLDISHLPPIDPALASLYEQIGQTVEADWTYLEAVFPEDPVTVMNALLERIFREPVHRTLEAILDQARQHSSLAYLMGLYTCHRASLGLLNRLRKGYARHLREWATRVGLSTDRTEVRRREVEAKLESLVVTGPFEKHLSPPEKYTTMEMNGFSELVTIITSHLATHAQQLKRTSRVTGMFSSLLSGSGITTTTTSATAGTNTTSAGTKTVGVASPIGSPLPVSAERYARLFSFGPNNKEGQNSAVRPLIPATLEDTSIVQIEVLRNCLMLHIQLLQRLYALIPNDGEVRGVALLTAISALLTLLIERYLEVSLECLNQQSSDNSDAANSNGGCDAHVWSVVRAVGRGLTLILAYVHDRALPLLVSASPTHYREMVARKTELATRLVAHIDQVLRRQLEISLAHVSGHLLPRQRKTDFKPRSDDLEAMACQAVCEFTRRLAKTVSEYLDGPNAANFLFEYGIGLHTQLLAHLRNFTVNDAGAMVIQSDLKAYRALADILSIGGIMSKKGSGTTSATSPATLSTTYSSLLADRFEMLWELGHLFVVRPENLRSVLQEGWLGRMDPRLIYPYIEMRADFASAKIDHLFPDMEKSLTRLFIS